MTYAILLLALGLALLFAETLVPSFGVLTLLATLAIVGASLFAFREGNGVAFLVAVCVFVPAVILLGLKVLPRTPLGKHFVSSGFSSEDVRAVDRRDADLLGAEGPVLAQLRPAGVARLGERRVDVVSRGEWIEAGARVRVIELQGNRVVVARVLEPAAAEPGSEGAPGGAKI